MPLYSFYPCDCDGVSAAFETCELRSDALAGEQAIHVLYEHPSCEYVDVWEDDRYVARKGRVHERPPTRNALTQSGP
jgi:hypothetical protein